MKIWDDAPTGLDLNGPIISITSHPSDTTACAGSNATLTVSASAAFPVSGDITGDGTITYEWHEVGVGALQSSTNIINGGATSLSAL